MSKKAATTSVVSSITRSGTTFTAKNSSGTQLFTFTQQDIYPTRQDTIISSGGYNGMTLRKFKYGNICIYVVEGTTDKNFVAGTGYQVSGVNTTEPAVYITGIDFGTRTIMSLYKNDDTNNRFTLVPDENIPINYRLFVWFWWIE